MQSKLRTHCILN